MLAIIIGVPVGVVACGGQRSNASGEKPTAGTPQEAPIPPSVSASAGGLAMKIQFTMDGGFAYFPGLSQPVDIDVASLPTDEATKLTELIHAAQFFALPAQVGTAPPGAADLRTYTITVDENGTSHTVKVSDPISDPTLQELVDHLRADAQRTRPGG
jgi:hypothetical protein